MRFRAWFLPLPFLCVVPLFGLASAFAGKPTAPKDIEVSLLGRHVEGDQEILAVKPQSLAYRIPHDARVVLGQPAGRPTPWSAVVPDANQGTLLLVRRQIPPASEKQTATIYPPEEHGVAPTPLRFALGDARRVPADPTLKARWLRSLRDGVANIPDTWAEHARARIDDLLQATAAKPGQAPAGKGKRAANVRVGVVQSDRQRDAWQLSNLMDTTTGLTSVREALQVTRQLRTRAAAEKASVPIASLAGPRIAQHPWPEMLAALGRMPPDEPLARAAPARFYYLRFASLAHLFRVLDEADAWITPAAAMSSGFSQNLDLGKRYEAQLGLSRSLVSRVLGPQVVTDVAVVGSDPYLREGTDLTFIFRVKSQAAFVAGLASALATHSAVHGQPAVETIKHAGIAITITRSADLAVRQHRAEAGGYQLVSNSLGAIKAVIDTIRKQSPALADAPDFRYMLARDAAVPTDVLGFMSDAFVAEVVGPRQKILESRRMLALGDLLLPGYEALLFGWMYGRPPRSLDEIVRAGLLAKDDLVHASGEAIAFAPGSAARSSWGTVAALTPLVDLPPLGKVTESERDAYRLFADSYQRNWNQYLDPVSLRLKLDPAAKGPLRADLRVLPLIDASEYREIQRTVGDARVDVPRLGSGALASLGVGPRAHLRRAVNEFAHELPTGLRSQLDWLGDLAFLGVEDRFNVKAFLDTYNREGHTREDEWARLFVEAPLHAGVAVRNALTAGLTLGALRQMATEAAPGAVEWSERGKERGIPYVGVSAVRGGDAHRFAGDVTLYYAFCKGYLLLSLSQATLKARIGECLDGRLPKPAGPGTAAGAQKPQLVLALAAKQGGPLWQLFGAGVALGLEEAQQIARLRAEVLLRGAPGLDPVALRRLAVAYTGGAPVDTSGVELTGAPPDSSWRWGGRHHHGRPVLPPANSPAYAFVAALARARSELAFDEEVKLAGAQQAFQSLHVVLTVGGEK
jgi:hypothetical protein